MYGKVLVAIDRSENSKRALAAARELVSLSDGEVRILHLREQEVIPRKTAAPGRPWLAGVTAP
jgi:nucleotide-binding universal stress UspA family protein